MVWRHFRRTCGYWRRQWKGVNFLPNGKFHWFAKKDDRHSLYAVHSVNSFYEILGGEAENVKSAIVYIPVTLQQKQKFDSIAAAYLEQTPYDYALFGMRCGAAAYEILGQLNILTDYSIKITSRKIFYPKKLRKRLLRLAERNGWTVINQDGSERRKWEKDWTMFCWNWVIVWRQKTKSSLQQVIASL